jgi:hypothetical protein
MTEETDFAIESEAIMKLNDEKQLVSGFAVVYERGGEEVVDYQGDVVDEEVVTKAAHEFMREYRHGKVLHRGDPVGEIVESAVLSRDVQKALGIDLGKSGWWVVYKVKDPDVWAKVKEGKLKAFSIGGRGIRKEISDE